MKTLSNKWLIITLGALLVVFFASRFFRAPGLESNLKQYLVKLDTASITQVLIKMPAEEEIKLIHSEGAWQVEKGNRKAKADKAIVSNAIASIAQVKPMRMISRKKDKWSNYQVDANGIQIAVYDEKEVIVNLIIGKTNFIQNQQGGFGGGYTYVRTPDEDEVYAVDGFLESSFKRNYDDWRNKDFLRVNRETVSRITFSYPSDSSFVIEKRDSIWMINGVRANQSNINSYLNQLSVKNLSAFKDDFNPTTPAPVIIQVEAQGGLIETIEAWPLPDSQWVLRSMLQPVIFSSMGSTVVNDLLKGRKYFIGG